MSYLRILWRKAAAGLTLLVGLLGATAAWAQVVKAPGEREPTRHDRQRRVRLGLPAAYPRPCAGPVGRLPVGQSPRPCRPEDYVESGLTEDAGASRGKK